MKRLTQCFFLWLALFIVNLGMMSPAFAAIPAQPQPNMTDEMIQSRIEMLLRTDNRVNWELLHVKVEQGHVTLFGEVGSPEEKGWAESIASIVPGVTGLMNNVIVEPALAPDHKIRTEVWTALKQIPALQGNRTLRVSVHDGVVTLQGDVRGTLAQQAAAKAAASVDGVQKVVNQLEVLAAVPRTGQAETRNPIMPGDGEKQIVP